MAPDFAPLSADAVAPVSEEASAFEQSVGPPSSNHQIPRDGAQAFRRPRERGARSRPTPVCERPSWSILETLATLAAQPQFPGSLRLPLAPAPFDVSGTGRGISVLDGLGPGLSLRLVGPFFRLSLIPPDFGCRAASRRATLVVNCFGSTGYCSGDALLIRRLFADFGTEGTQGDGKSDDENRADREADEVDAGRRPSAEAGQAKFSARPIGR